MLSLLQNLQLSHMLSALIHRYVLLNYNGLCHCIRQCPLQGRKSLLLSAAWPSMGLPGQLLHSGGQVIHGLAFSLLTAAQTFPSPLPLKFPLVLHLEYL